MLDVPAIAALAGVAVLLGATLQAATGFGFSMVCAPLLFAAVPPEAAIGLVTVLGLEVNLLTLGSERRRPAPLRRTATALLAWSVPGLVAGVVVLQALDATALQVLVTVAVLGSLAGRRLRPPAVRPPAWALPVSGVAAGTLATAAGPSGVPLVLYLLARGGPPARVRDTLTVVFVGQAIVGSAALLALGATAAIPDPGALAALSALVLAGHLAGRRAFAWLADGRYERALTGVLLTSALTGLATAVL